VFRGWRQADLADIDLERNGIALFEALYAAQLLSS